MSGRYIVPAWPLPAGLHAAFSLRAGGCSAGPWSSLNLAMHVGDAPQAVTANRALLARDLDLPSEPLWLQQVHGTGVISVDEEQTGAQARPADAIVARTAGVLAILVADCLPVLLASKDGAVYGAAHAGWRGLAGGVLEQTLAAMRVPPAELTAWLGPCIRRDAFEVGDEVRAVFGQPFAWAFSPNKNGRWQCDLAAIAAARLRAAGVAALSDCGLCTHADSQRFFSHRRDAAVLGSSGRMAALLWRAVSS